MFIGICGASGSGKSTLAQEMAAMATREICIINQDAYYLDHPEMTLEERKKLNYDAPDIFDHDLLFHDMQMLLAGKPITQKRYDYTCYRRMDSDELLLPCEVIILEGIHVFYDARLRDMRTLKLYMHVEPDICLLRRISRDIKERGRHIDGISEQYLGTVKPMFDRYIRNYIEYADVIVGKGGKNAKIAEILAGYINNGLHL